MQLFKQLALRLSLIGMTLVMFFIGLGVAVVAAVVLLVARLFIKPTSHAELREKWAQRQAKYQNCKVIDGQYHVVDTQ